MQMHGNGFKLLPRFNHHTRGYGLIGVRRIIGKPHEIQIKEDCGRDTQKKENEKYAGQLFQFNEYLLHNEGDLIYIHTICKK